jgi:conjugal transfer/entry exclusion protein
MKQTAVEWLAEQLEQHHIKIDIKNTVVFQQAKAMEKEQIVDAFDSGQMEEAKQEFWTKGYKYYNETYGTSEKA